jgi:hypothetical protein
MVEAEPIFAGHEERGDPRGVTARAASTQQSSRRVARESVRASITGGHHWMTALLISRTWIEWGTCWWGSRPIWASPEPVPPDLAGLGGVMLGWEGVLVDRKTA